MKNKLLALLILVMSFGVCQAQDEPVIDFYLSQLDSAFQSEFIFVSDASFSVEVKSIMIMSNYRAEIDKVDTAVYKLYYSGQIDSVTVIDSALTIENNVLPSKLTFKPPWYDNNKFFFYPNDTGGTTLAIGFRPDSMEADTVVTGFLNMNRYDSKLKSIFLFDPDPEDYAHLSRIYYFGPRDQYQILLTYEIQGTELTLFGRHYFRKTMEFSNYEFYK